MATHERALNVHRASGRGVTSMGWLQSYHSFSFGRFYDPDRMGFRTLRVFNDDRVQPDQGFGMHGHQDMEILSYVLAGELEHRDSLGTGSVLKRGDVQVMSAGTGIRHSEANPSPSEEVHFLQLWIEPKHAGLAPRYDDAHFSDDAKRGNWRVIASPDQQDGSLLIQQDARVFATLLRDGESVSFELAEGRYAWLFVAEGKIVLEEIELAAGDAVDLAGPLTISPRALGTAELLRLDLG